MEPHLPHKRQIDPAFLEAIRQLSCLACGKYGPSEAHHIRSRGAGGGDDFFNLIPLCKEHHTMGHLAWHQIGALNFLEKFPHVEEYILQLGWVIFNGKLIPPPPKLEF